MTKKTNRNNIKIIFLTVSIFMMVMNGIRSAGASKCGNMWEFFYFYCIPDSFPGKCFFRIQNILTFLTTFSPFAQFSIFLPSKMPFLHPFFLIMRLSEFFKIQLSFFRGVNFMADCLSFQRLCVSFLTLPIRFGQSIFSGRYLSFGKIFIKHGSLLRSEFCLEGVGVI